MDRIEKFLKKLGVKERGVFEKLFVRIMNLELDGLDIKPLKGHRDVFRLRKGKIRIVFGVSGKMGFVISVGYRKDVYK